MRQPGLLSVRNFRVRYSFSDFRVEDGRPMGNFGEPAHGAAKRNVALEDITAVCKISQHHLVALEQNGFAFFPAYLQRSIAGIPGLSASTSGTGRSASLKPTARPPAVIDDDRSWTRIRDSVGKARMLRRDALEMRLRWAGAILLLLVAAAAFLTVRYFGERAGWWNTLLPTHQAKLLPGNLNFRAASGFADNRRTITY